MSEAVEILVVISWSLAPFTRRNDRVNPALLKATRKGVTVISFVGQQIFSLYALDKPASLCAICNGTCCNKHSDRHTMRIHGQVYLGVEPPFVRSMS